MSVEDVKRSSAHLRGTLAEELAGDKDAFEHDSTVLLKFHGIYQQDDRDVRRSRTQQKLPLDYSCMVRTSVPGGGDRARPVARARPPRRARRRCDAPDDAAGRAVPLRAEG